MITMKAMTALVELAASADAVVVEWWEYEDRTHIKPGSLRRLRKALQDWKSLEMIEG